MEDLDRNQLFRIAWLRVAPALLPALVLVAVALPPLPAFAHGGGLNSNGCHTNSRTSDYHCHRVSSREAPRRSGSARSAFRREYACPATGQTTGSCPRWEVDHVIPLACGGRDAPSNMQWLRREENRRKGDMGCSRR